MVLQQDVCGIALKQASEQAVTLYKQSDKLSCLQDLALLLFEGCENMRTAKSKMT